MLFGRSSVLLRLWRILLVGVLGPVIIYVSSCFSDSAVAYLTEGATVDVVALWEAIVFVLRRMDTYTWEFGAAVTALGSCAALLEVKQTEAATGRLDDTDLIGACVVSVQTNCQLIFFSHLCRTNYRGDNFVMDRLEETYGLRRRYWRR